MAISFSSVSGATYPSICTLSYGCIRRILLQLDVGSSRDSRNSCRYVSFYYRYWRKTDVSKKYDEIGREKDSDSAYRWNFPKMHSHVHLFDDILAKGVTRNMNTKPNEKMHGPLKQSYQLQTNFKETDEQVSDSASFASTSADQGSVSDPSP